LTATLHQKAPGIAANTKAGRRRCHLDTHFRAIYDENTMKPSMKTAIQRNEELRSAMRTWTSGVTIVTAAHGDETHGMTVSSFTSISLDPPLIVVSLQTASRTHDLVSRAMAFGVTILAANQQELSERFASDVDAMDRLRGLETETMVTGAPFIKGGLAYLDCRVQQTIQAGMNTIFIGEVVAVRGDDHTSPLVYHDRAYARLEE
jgi:flavin reductase (DIM6/NTAB) family NADH-FMN oxidoreductase RutF